MTYHNQTSLTQSPTKILSRVFLFIALGFGIFYATEFSPILIIPLSALIIGYAVVLAFDRETEHNEPAAEIATTNTTSDNPSDKAKTEPSTLINFLNHYDLIGVRGTTPPVNVGDVSAVFASIDAQDSGIEVDTEPMISETFDSLGLDDIDDYEAHD